MSKTLRRFEVLLPLRFNDGQPVSEETVVDTLVELEQRCGVLRNAIDPGDTGVTKGSPIETT